MIDDILNNFQEWFFDGFNSENTLSVKEVDIETDSLSIYSDEIAIETSENSETVVDNFYPEELSVLNVVDSLHNLLNWFVPENQWNIDEFDGWGSPEEHAQFWQKQQGENSCAVVAQTNIYESITGNRISEEQACEIAQENGWFDPETGTHPNDVGKLLNELGIPTEQRYDAELDDIADALEKGDRVIVGLDANEIWYPLRDNFGNPIEQTNAGHAVWVTGVDTQPDGSVKIILNDSGHPNGKMAVIDAVDFVNAWQDFGNFLVVADAPELTLIA
ncbi:MAG: hypothetical protein AB4372_08635 [Xenococcus sp. (in: cyanobacteria)]